MPRITHIELNSDIPEKLGSFYAKVFGWIVQKKEPGSENYWFLISGGTTEPGVNAGMKKRMVKSMQWVPTIHVDNIDAALKKITDHGGKITHAKRAVPATGYLAYGEDPEGNLFGILEKDSSIKS